MMIHNIPIQNEILLPEHQWLWEIKSALRALLNRGKVL